ncbi:hypothetical protein [Streptomyces sp. NPDC048527]|uniref:hypothetical protein n=1 Tax=Streptomyces sp. NPDC048527 TaxID=3365568 RepID=UPI003713D485
MTPRAVPRTAVVAIGGNALLRGGTHATVAEQADAARRLAPPVVAPADSGRLRSLGRAGSSRRRPYGHCPRQDPR